jgi:hypothetical protein
MSLFYNIHFLKPTTFNALLRQVVGILRNNSYRHKSYVEILLTCCLPNMTGMALAIAWCRGGMSGNGKC